MKEDFSNRRNYFLKLTLITFIIGLINGFILIIQILKKSAYREMSFSLIGFNVMILLLSPLFVQANNYYSSRYIEVTPALKAKEEGWKKSHKDFILGKIKNRYDRMPLNTYRILFVGSSQTLGGGTSYNNENFVRIVERKLNERNNKNIYYECINGGVAGFESKTLFHIYEDEWLTLKPKLVVINLSNNDSDRAVFSQYLERFVALNKSQGIQTAFILEANSIEENPGSLPLHSVMKKIGKKYKIPVMNLHQFLLDNYNKGFLWWDPVHLASFGHALAGNFLTDEILKIITD